MHKTYNRQILSLKKTITKQSTTRQIRRTLITKCKQSGMSNILRMRTIHTSNNNNNNIPLLTLSDILELAKVNVERIVNKTCI